MLWCAMGLHVRRTSHGLRIWGVLRFNIFNLFRLVWIVRKLKNLWYSVLFEAQYNLLQDIFQKPTKRKYLRTKISQMNCRISYFNAKQIKQPIIANKIQTYSLSWTWLASPNRCCWACPGGAVPDCCCPPGTFCWCTWLRCCCWATGGTCNYRLKFRFAAIIFSAPKGFLGGQ